MSDRRGGGKQQSFEEWLHMKQTAEQSVIDVRKREEARQKLAEEDRYVVLCHLGNPTSHAIMNTELKIDMCTVCVYVCAYMLK